MSLPVINYFVVQQFADAHRVSYNELAKMVRDAVTANQCHCREYMAPAPDQDKWRDCFAVAAGTYKEPT